MINELKFVGQPSVRIDGKEKITGTTHYTDDIDFGVNLLYAAIVESTEAHAKIIEIDISEAKKVSGVVEIFTGEDFPFKFGLYMKDRYIFAMDRVHYVGQQIAAVVARDRKTAEKAAKLVKIKYEPLPALFNQMDSLKDDAPLIHPELNSYSHVPWFFPKAKTNIAHWRKTRRGNTEKGFEDADFILEDTYHVPRYAHCPLETHVAVGLCDLSDRLTIWASSQSPHTQRNLFAESLAPLGFTNKDIRVIAPPIGGGFGGKAGVSMEIIAAAIATKVKGNPVKLIWTREQEFYNTSQRLGMIANLKIGVTKEGKFTAIDHKLYWDTGASAEYGANVVNAVGLSAIGPYRFENVSIDSVCLYTNLPPCGAYRGFGYSEFMFGLESHIDRIASKLNLDAVEIRKMNAIRENDLLAYGVPMNPNGLMQCIEEVAKEIEWDKKVESNQVHKKIGKGFSLIWKAPAMPPNASSAAFIKFNEDGSLNILVSGMDMGQGYLTVMAQIAAEILTVPVSKIRTENPDTDRNPYEWQTVASHVTWSCGNAVRKAAINAKEQIIDLVSNTLHLPKDMLYLDDEKVKCQTQPDFQLLLSDFVINGIQVEDGTFRGGPIMGHGTFMPEYASAKSDPETSQGGHPNVHYTVGAAAITLEIDEDTGEMHVLKAVEAIDVGKAINPSLVKGQITGGLLQGLATVLYEDMRFDEKGKLLNPNFTDYKIPTAKDIPDEIVPIIIEVPQPDGPFGAKGVGEHTMIPAAPMIANAIQNALDLRIKTMPITKEKVALANLKKRKKL